MSEQGFHIPYSLKDKARLFDLGQGIHSNTSLVLKKGGGTVTTMTQTLKKMRVQALLFGLLAVAQVVLLQLLVWGELFYMHIQKQTHHFLVKL